MKVSYTYIKYYFLITYIRKQWNKYRHENKLRAGTSYNTDYLDYVFLTRNGNILYKSCVNNAWNTFLKRCGVEHKKFHALRHTYATLQFENDVPFKNSLNLIRSLKYKYYC